MFFIKVFISICVVWFILHITKWVKVWKTSNGTYKKYTDRFEIESLNLLKNTCTCGRGPHFPCLISLQDNVIEITNCGESIQSSNINITDIHDYDIQLDCIFNSLSNANIIYTDITTKNICVDRQNRISLIDFEGITFKHYSDLDYLQSTTQLYWKYLYVTGKISAYIHNHKMFRLAYNPSKRDEWCLHFKKCMLSPIKYLF